MKKTYLIIIFFISINVSAQQITFNETFGELNNVLETAGTSIEIPGIGFIIPYDLWKWTVDSSKIAIFLIDYSGNLILNKFYGSDTIGGWAARKIISTSDGNFIITGNFRSKGSNLVYGYLLKINQNCDTLWTKVYTSGQLLTIFTDVVLTFDNHFLITGFTQDFQGTNYYQSQIYLIKTDSIGNIIWDKFLGDVTNYEYATNVIELEDSSIVVSGYKYLVSTGFNKGLIFKLDKDGDFIKQKNLTSVNDLALTDALLASDGNIYISGEYGISPNPPYNYLGYIIKLDTALNVIWSDSIGFNQQWDGFNSITESYNNRFILAGATTNLSQNFTQNGWIASYDMNGNALWERQFAPTQNYTDIFYSIQKTSDEGYLACGSSQIYDSIIGNWNQQVWVVKVDSLGCDIDGCPTILWTSVDEINSASHQHLNIYPNPFSGNLNISFTLDANKEIKIELFNSLGQVVKTISNKKYTGKNEINFSVAGLPYGIYHLKFSAGDEVVVKRVVKM